MRRVALALLLLIFLSPIGWTLIASFNLIPFNQVSPAEWRNPPTLDAYIDIRAQQTAFWQQLFTSLGVSIGATLLAVTVGFLAAYGLVRSGWKTRHRWAQSLLILASLPAIAYLIALRDLLRYVCLFDTLPGILLAQTALVAPLVAYILYGYLATAEAEIEDAARLDGAGLLALLWRIVLPSQRAAITATGLIAFILAYNQFFLPLLLTQTHVKMMPVIMRDFFTLEREFDWQIAAAVIIITLTPVALLVTGSQSWLERFRLTDLTD